MPVVHILLAPEEHAQARACALDLLRLGKAARRGGLLSLNTNETYHGLPFLGRLGLHIVLEGTDPVDVRRVLTTFLITDGKHGWPLMHDWLSISALSVLQGDRAWPGLLVHWSELLGNAMTDDLRLEFAAHGGDTTESESWDTELQACLSAMPQIGQRLRCTDSEKRSLLPLLAWLVRACTRARRSGFAVFERDIDEALLPDYLRGCLPLLMDQHVNPEEIGRRLEAAARPDQHSGVSLVERMLATTWLSLLLEGAHPRIMFESLSGYLGEAYYPTLRGEMKRLGARKPTETSRAATAPVPVAPQAAPSPAALEADRPDPSDPSATLETLQTEIDPAGGASAGDLTQEEINALLAPDDDEEVDPDGPPAASETLLAKDATPSVLSQDEVDELLSAVQSEGGGVESPPLEGSATDVAALIADLFGAQTDAGSVRASLCRTYALLGALLHPGAPHLLDHCPPELQLKVAQQLVGLRARLPDPLEDLRLTLTEACALTEEELPTQGVRQLAQLIDRMPIVRPHVLDVLEEEEHDLFVRMKEYRFEFEDVSLLDDQALQKVFGSVGGLDPADLARALKPAAADLQERVLGSASVSESELLRKNMESLGAMRLAEVEAARDRICIRVLELAEAGDIVILRAED